MVTTCRAPRLRSVTAGLVVLSLLGQPVASYGQEDQNIALFNARYRSGTQALEQQNYAEAIKFFQLAYAQKPEALLLFNIAQCHRKLNHEAEAITYYQSYLNTPEAVDEQLRAKAERYIAELRHRQAPPPPKVIYVETARQPRPGWRIGLGIGLLAASSVPLGIGGRALYLNGSCADTPMGTQMRCTSVVDTQPLGTGLVVAGVLLAIGGVMTIAIPGSMQKVQRPVAPENAWAPAVVKPMAQTMPLLLPGGGVAELPAAAEY